MLKLYCTVSSYLSTTARKLFKKEEGASLVEYGLLVALIAAACMATLFTLGGKINTLFTNVSNRF